MTNRRNVRATALGSCIVAILAAAAANAQQQGASAGGAEATELQEVVVTGSRIKRSAATAPTPLIELDRAAILESGQASVIDRLADIPALAGSIVPEDTTGSGLNDGGLSLLNLRDLGTNRTLVLVDGRRHVGSNPGTLSVDIDTIPRLLIERVELVTGANSAQYGADAVSGVVNFILRRDFSGIEADGSYAEINKGGQINKRASLLAGHNLFGERLNVYGSFEHEQNEEVRDSDIDWRRNAVGFLVRDFDPTSAPDDGIIDQVLVSGLRNVSRSRGGTLTLVSDIAPNPALNIPNQRCPAGTTGAVNALCIIPEPGLSYQFDANGVARLANFGTARNLVGRARNLNIGGDGLNINTEFSQFSRLPKSEADRFQGGFNLNITDSVQFFGEFKYVEEETFDESQQTFFDIGIVPQPAGTNTGLFGTASFNIGIDNAYLDPAVRTAIQNNRRATFTAAGVPTGLTVADPRARLSIFGPPRTQLNQKELTRYVAGFRGGLDDLGFVQNLNFELSYTHGELENVNFETAVDVIRFKHSVDAVVDTLGQVNGRPGEVVCRVRLLAAQGVTIPDQFRGGNYNPTNPEIANCTPSRVFGEGGYDAAARDFFGATIRVVDRNEQDNAIGFVSGEAFDLWGAGPMGFAAGAEWREERTSGIGRSTSTGDRFLFLNTGADFPEAKYDTTEWFTELRLPLLTDAPLARQLEVGAAFRRSDYSTIGQIDTDGFNVIWRPIEDITFRATWGTAIRVPNLGENFRPATQTFANGFVDPCSATVINSLTDATIRANRERNCVALGIPNGTVITYTSGVPGRNAGNPFLKPESSDTRTLSMIVQPRFLPRTTFVFDFYEITIKDVIAAVSAQVAANQCVNGQALDPAICATITRGGATATIPYGVIDFIQGSINYAKLYTRGIDFQFQYNHPTDSFGNFSFSISGNHLMDNHQFTNVSNPRELTLELEDLVGFPTLRFNTTLDWQLNEKFGASWEMDWQRSQEIIDPTTLAGNNDLYATKKYYRTRPFIQHDLTLRYSPMENLTLRGGVVNLTDNVPSLWLGNTSSDNFDLFDRRYYLGLNYKL